jgi:hypothetical protein
MVYECSVNEFVDIEWTFSNNKNCDVVLFVRILPTEKRLGPDQEIVSPNLIFVGSLESIVRIKQGEQKAICLKVMITSVSSIQFICYAEEVGVKMRETVITKSKYEPPELILGSIEKVFYFSYLVSLRKDGYPWSYQ